MRNRAKFDQRPSAQSTRRTCSRNVDSAEELMRTPNGPALNQCDGCRRGLPIRNGLHYEPDEARTGVGMPVMCCTRDRYEKPPPVSTHCR